MAYQAPNPNGQATSANSAPVVNSSDQMPAGQTFATGAKQDTGNASLATIATNLPAKGQATAAASQPVVLATDQSIIPVRTTTGYAAVTGTVTASGNTVVLPSATGVGSVTIAVYGTYAGVNLSYEAYDGTNWQGVFGRLTTGTTPTPSNTTGTITTNATTTYEVPFLLGFTQFRVRANAWTSGTANIIILPSSQFASPTTYATSVQSGTWTVQPGNTANTTPWLVAEQKSATSATTSVTATTTSTTIIALNTARKGLYVFNDSTAVLYLAFAATASTTAYITQVPANSLYEMPAKPTYTGLVTGIWSAANGAARVTELT